jgi:lysophospholipase L1-like esterase
MMKPRVLLAGSAIIAAGLFVAWNLTAEERFTNEIAAFVERDRTNPPPQNAVLFVGSSSIRLWTNLASDFPKLQTINRGFGGSHISDVIEYVDKIVIPYRPSKIVFYAGDNDIASGKPPGEVREDFETFVKRVWEKLPETPIYFLAIKPSPSRWHLISEVTEANKSIREFTKTSKQLHYIDVATPLLNSSGEPDESLFRDDKLHLNEKGYAIWTRVVNGELASK